MLRSKSKTQTVSSRETCLLVSQDEAWGPRKHLAEERTAAGKGALPCGAGGSDPLLVLI